MFDSYGKKENRSGHIILCNSYTEQFFPGRYKPSEYENPQRTYTDKAISFSSGKGKSHSVYDD